MQRFMMSSIIGALHTSSKTDMPADIPEVVLLQIFSYIPPRQLLTQYNHVCKHWNKLINETSLWKTLCMRKNITVLPIYPFDFKRIAIFNPFGRNLVKNGDASESMNHWNVMSQHHSNFLIESPGAGVDSFDTIETKANIPACWATTYMWCIKQQTIHLLKEGITPDVMDDLKPDILFEEWVAHRFDCASEYTSEVMLLSEDDKMIDSFTKTRREHQWVGREWHKITHTFCDYDPGVRKISVKHGGKDSQFWAGHYGPKITATSLYVQVTPDNLQQWQ